MGLDVLREKYGQQAAAAGDSRTQMPVPEAEDRILGLPSGHDSEGWREVINMRLRRAGAYPQLEARGGSASIDAALNSLNGKVLTLERVETQVGDTPYRLLFVHDATGSLYSFETLTDTFTPIVDAQDQAAVLFSQTRPIYVLNVGRLVYFFDPDTGRNRVWSIEDETLTDWNGISSPEISAASIGSAPFNEPWPEDNVFGFKKGRSIIAIPAKAELVPSDSIPQLLRDRFQMTDSSFWFYLDYDGARETIELSTGTEIRTSGFYFVPKDVGIKATADKGSGTLPDQEHRPDFKYVQTKPFTGLWRAGLTGESVDELFAVKKLQIVEYSENEVIIVPGEPNLVANVPTITANIQGGNTESVINKAEKLYGLFKTSDESPALNHIALPHTPALEEVLNYAARFISTSNGIEVNDEFEMPELFRAYAIVNVLEDGSVTLPGAPVVVSTPADKILEDSLAYVRLDIPAAVTGVASRYLISTRWKIRLGDVFLPSGEIEPNGPWYINKELDKTAYPVYDDDRSDFDLIRELSEILPLAAGIPLTFGAGELSPITVSQHKGTFFMGGYSIQRPEPEAGRNFTYEAAGDDVADTEVFVLFEYSDGKFSAAVSLGPLKDGESNTLSFYGLNSLVKNVSVYVTIPAGDRLIHAFGWTDPEFLGRSISIPDSTFGLEAFEAPTAGDIQPVVRLPDHILPLLPPQSARIDAQVQAADSSEIRNVIPVSFDRDKTQMRFRFLIQTSTNVQVGYFTESAGPQGPVFDSWFEVWNQSMGTDDGYGARRVGEHVFLTGRHGLYAVTVGGNGQLYPRLIMDRNRFPEARFPLRSVVEQPNEFEYWFLFDRDDDGDPVDVFVTDAQSIRMPITGPRPENPTPVAVRRFRFENTSFLPERMAQAAGDIFIALNNCVLRTDIPGAPEDKRGVTVLNTIKGRLDSEHLFGPMEQMKLLLLGVSGQGADVTPRIDAQPSRRRNTTDNWEPEFQEAQAFEKRTAEIRETLWDIRRQAIMPRLRLDVDFKGTGFIQYMRLRFRALRNRGMARTSIKE